ncbi:MAG: exodeoxyribonuclease VII large subunit [Lachnospiraceae bacterium]|nr:exodeoxyribonuclease VII large subunit [Lachnospiraceae bacterium]
MSTSVYTVGQINRYIRGMFSQDILLSSVRVRGEVSNCKYHTSGHIFFSLKDATGTINCIMFAGNRRGMDFRMADGDKVIADGSIEVYERDGRYQLYAKKISREGAGELYERFVRLKKELAEMGMFDPRYKKPVPKYAKRIGIVTAPTGAAIRDIQNIAGRRNPYVELILYPALVQGEGAKESIVRGIEILDGAGVDVIIVGRGGGSIEDLWAFNEEVVAQAIFDCETPIISAVGHETDITIADYVADLRAPTPSAAAELAVFDFRAFKDALDRYRTALRRGPETKLNHLKMQLRLRQTKLAMRSPEAAVREKRRMLLDAEDALCEALAGKILLLKARADNTGRRLADGMTKALYRDKLRLHGLIGRLKGLNPMDRLSQGFSFVTDEDGNAFTSVKSAHEGDVLTIFVSDGKVRAAIREVIDHG